MRLISLTSVLPQELHSPIATLRAQSIFSSQAQRSPWDSFGPRKASQDSHGSPPDETAWETWLRSLFSSYLSYPFAEHQREFWEWAWSIERGVKPRPFVGIWARGGAKSTSAEMFSVAMGALQKRKYGLYLSGTQDQADDHVSTVSAMLESPEIAAAYPLLSDRELTKFGTARGWRRNRLWTASGLVVDAIGLDASKRGAKLGSSRPDFMVLDDLDGELDSLSTVDGNLQRLSRKLLPAGSEDCAVLAIQNLVIPHGVFARLARHEGAPATDILSNRVLSGPIPALRDLVWEQGEGGAIRLVSGDPSWAGQSLEVCQQQATEWGFSAFLQEAQHEVDAPDGGMFSHIEWRRCIEEEMPELVMGAVWVDPAVTDTDQSDSHGVIAGGLGVNGVVYFMRSWEGRTSPLESLRRAIGWARALQFDRVGVETDQGGDTWASVYQQACQSLGLTRANAPQFLSAKAGAGHGPKAHRASQMLGDYERGRIVHVVGTHGVLERGLRRFPRTKPFDLVDAAYWLWRDLRNQGNASKQEESVPMRLWR